MTPKSPVIVYNPVVTNSSQRLRDWLEILVQKGGSDLFLVVGQPASIRVTGSVLRLEEAPLEGHEIQDAVLSSLPPHAAEAYRKVGYADSSLRLMGLGRFRINLHHERGRPAATIRALAARPPRFSELNLPTSVLSLSRIPYGLVLVGGPTGSGKTTTLAALVDEINRREAKHIITIEDPIEYEHGQHRSIVEQVEIGIDAPDFPTALRSALRQAPDVIVIGEMRDPETMRMALTAGETGHLVFSTLHTDDCTRCGLVPAGTSGDDSAGAFHIAGRGHDAESSAAHGGRSRSRGRAPDDRVWRKAAHSQERTTAPPSGDHYHASEWIVHFRGISCRSHPAKIRDGRGSPGKDRSSRGTRQPASSVAVGALAPWSAPTKFRL
jgi:hypothetical protein